LWEYNFYFNQCLGAKIIPQKAQILTWQAEKINPQKLEI